MLLGFISLLLCGAVQETNGNAVGYWETICVGCNGEISITQKASKGSKTTLTEVEKKEVSSTISAGFSFGFVEGSASVSGAIAEEISSEMESTINTDIEYTINESCDKDYFFQWKMTVSGSDPIYLDSPHTLCINNEARPDCIYGFCTIDGKQAYKWINLYRWYSTVHHDNRITFKGIESDFLKEHGYTLVGETFKVLDIQKPGTIPIYAKYNANNGDSMLTINEDEGVDQLYKTQYILGFCYPSQRINDNANHQLIRLSYPPSNHVSTIDLNEVNVLKSTGYDAEYFACWVQQ